MTYRNRALLDLAHEAPCFLLPGQHECLGQPAEPCHSDMIRHGRGENHKSHDCFAPPGCHNAHLAFTRSNLGKEGYFQAWIEAMERYILWQWVTGKVRLADITQRAKETTMEAPFCKVCQQRHYVRDPHILPADAPGEVRSKRAQTETPKERTPETPGAGAPKPVTKSSSGLNVHVSSVSLAKSQPESGKRGKQQRINCGRDSRERPAMNSSLGAMSQSKRIRQEGALNDAGGSANAVIAAGAMSAPMGESPERTPGANRAQNGVTAARGCKNTSREGRDVLKAQATSTERDHREAQPATPGKKAGRQGTAAKPAPGKRKTATKIIATYTAPKAKRKWVKKP